MPDRSSRTAAASLASVFRIVGFAVALTQFGCSTEDPPPRLDCFVPIGDAPQRGPADAWVTIVEFGDFQCPYCGKAQPILADVDARRPGLRWAFKHFPLTTIHPNALPAALAAQCAKEQGKFWEMHDLLFANQARLDEASLIAYATELALDMTAWQSCRDSEPALAAVSADFELGYAIGVSGTPSYFIKGAELPGAYPSSDFLDSIDAAERAAKASGTPASDYYAANEKRGCQGL